MILFFFFLLHLLSFLLLVEVEFLKQEFDKKECELKDKARNAVIDKYGGEEHLDAPPRALLLAQTEEYIEYSRTGNVSFYLFINSRVNIW